jgi:hypothetical protein
VVVVVVANRSINQSDSGRCAAAWTPVSSCCGIVRQRLLVCGGRFIG